jgi:hypothetical protein
MNELEALVVMYKFSLHDAKVMTLRERANWINRHIYRQNKSEAAHA